MSGKEENGADCGDDDEWGDLITTPNPLISDDFFVLKAEKMGNGEEDEQQLEQKQESRVCSDGRSRRVSIAERRAAKCGSDANASGINVSVSSSPSVSWSQLLTIPSSISPTSLLDCPMMLPNSQASPTTGTMLFPPPTHEIFWMNSEVEDGSCDNGSFIYGPHGGSLLWPCISDLQNQAEFPGALLKETVAKSSAAALDSSKAPKTTIQNTNGASIQPPQTNNQTPPIKQSTQAYQKDTNLANMQNSEDGYNWRKYGQKQVKGSEYPRSYYKCTHPNCQVKKKVERSHDGHITEIIYKGAHNHQIPHLGQRNIIGSPSSVNGTSQICEANGSYIKMEDREVWGNNYITDGLERSSSTSVLTDNSDLISLTQGKSMAIFDCTGNPELSSSNTNCDVNDDGTNIGTLSPGDEAEEDKSDLKRRKKGNFLLETSLVSRAMREPRVVVQIESDVDILDDGYRWRKYGQKVVKGNPNPRSYYKCTSAGCPVRKHVERASDDLKAVLTTYEGKHNHEVPAARNSTHANLDVSNTPNLSLPRITNVPKPETQVQDLPLRFDRKLTNEYIPSNFVASFDTEPTKFEASSIYQTKFLPLQSPMPFGSVAPGLPDFPISVPPHMVHTGFGFNNAKCIREAPPFIGGQRFIKPKLEQDDSFYDSRCCRMIPHFPS